MLQHAGCKAADVATESIPRYIQTVMLRHFVLLIGRPGNSKEAYHGPWPWGSDTDASFR